MQFIRRQTALFLCMFPIFISAQNAEHGSGSASGTVIDQQGRPVAGLHVMVEHSALGTVTDTAGRYHLQKIPSGIYTLIYSHIAFQTQRFPAVLIKSGQNASIDTLIMTTKVLKGPTVVVTATRGARTATETAAAINVLPQSAIRERNVKSLSEALREEPGVSVQKTSHGGGSAIIRGLSSNMVLLMVDGIRLNNSTYRRGNHPYLTLVDYQMVKQMEVVRGPMSVLYGSDALGGTVNAITDIQGLTHGAPGLNYRLFSRFSTADRERSSHAEIAWNAKRWALETGVSLKDFGDLRRGTHASKAVLERSTDAVQAPSAFSATDANAKLIFRADARRTLIAAWQMSRRPKVPRYDKYENSGYHRWHYVDQNRDLGYIKYQDDVKAPWLSSLSATLSYQRQGEGRETQKTLQHDIAAEYDRVGTLGLTLQGLTERGRHALTWGTESYFDHVRSRAEIRLLAGGTTAAVRGRYPDGATYQQLGLYLQDEIHMAATTTVIPGLRYSRMHTDFTLPLDADGQNWEHITQQFDALTASLGLIHQLGDGCFLNANLGQAFRAPNLSDIGKLGESKGSTWEVPNPALKSETMLSMDLGLKIEREHLSLSASFYYAAIDHLIATADFTTNAGASVYDYNGVSYKVKAKQNLGKAYLRGMESALAYDMGHGFCLRGNWTLTYGQNTTLQEPMGKLPPAFGLAGLRWACQNFHAELYTRWAGKQNRLSADDLDDDRIPHGGTPAWQTLNLRTVFQPFPSIKLHAAVENLLDRNYREHGSGINAPGRNFILSLEYRRQ